MLVGEMGTPVSEEGFVLVSGLLVPFSGELGEKHHGRIKSESHR